MRHHTDLLLSALGARRGRRAALAALSAAAAGGLLAPSAIVSRRERRQERQQRRQQRRQRRARRHCPRRGAHDCCPRGGGDGGGDLPISCYRVVTSYPHDPKAFTQGLIVADGVLYEGTGLHGRSSLRRVALESGEVLQLVPLAPRYFGEGIALHGDTIYQLTWREQTCFLYDRATLAPTGSFSYTTEGWGLASDGTRLIMSDGSSRLVFRDPATFAVIGQIEVRAGGEPVPLLNELEAVNGEIWANVWQTDRVARIEPATGEVRGWIDLRGLLSEEERAGRRVDVLNGIAYDRAAGRLFVTGKLWPVLYEIVLTCPCS